MPQHRHINDFRGNFIDGVARIGPRVTAEELERIISVAPEGGTVRLTEGEFIFNDSITVNRSDVALSGAGAGKPRSLSAKLHSPTTRYTVFSSRGRHNQCWSSSGECG
ncbi:hypothetical protein [Modicisalibacter luteus]|uniref:hypothetical protein n=1 Tax=Modicisalibacter luteus TaxID=453962 RepID=UPI00364377EA